MHSLLAWVHLMKYALNALMQDYKEKHKRNICNGSDNPL